MSTDPNQDANGLAQHFTDVASHYDIDELLYSPSSSHGQWLTTIIFNALDLKRDHILVDVGCGNGNDCLWILNKMNNEINVIGNDISSGMIKIFDNERTKRNLDNVVRTFCMDAVTFSEQEHLPAYNRLFMKEIVHLLSRSERLLAFKGFYRQFNSEDNKLLIVGRPSKEIFPFDQRTQEIYTSATPSFDTYVEELKMCGFTNVQCDTYEYTFDDNITLVDWISFIQKRLWSIFQPDKFNDKQMADCLSYLNETYKNQNFRLKDEMIILHCTAEKQKTS